jgi:hypothetical protein
MTPEFIADQLFKNRARSSCRDMKQREAGCRDAPDPMLLTFVLDACFVAAELRLLEESPF